MYPPAIQAPVQSMRYLRDKATVNDTGNLGVEEAHAVSDVTNKRQQRIAAQGQLRGTEQAV